MTEVVVARHHRYTQSIGNLDRPMPAMNTAPSIEMIPNSEFSFPRLPVPQASHFATSQITSTSRRPLSMNLPSMRPQTADATHHRRGQSQVLPVFNFNVADSTGLDPEQTEVAQSTPFKGNHGNHKRNASEFVGGLGVNGAMSSSPTKSTSHFPRRSRNLALSSHDLSNIMVPPEPQQYLSSSLPNTPLEHPAQTPGRLPHPDEFADISGTQDPFGPPLDEAPTRPPSRPRVEFSENVEYIPRPLSTISSETESSLSTVRAHSVNNSISSVLSLSTPSPPSSRARVSSLETTMEDEPKAGPRSSLEINRRVEREGEWLKNASSHEQLQRPLSEPMTNSPKLSFVANDPPVKSRQIHKKRQSLSHALGFDRRKSEPAIGMHVGESSRLSALSLQEPAPDAQFPTEGREFAGDRRSSSRKIKDWAVAKISWKSRDLSRIQHEFLAAPAFETRAADAGETKKPAAAETDLDAVFSLESDASTGTVRVQPHVEIQVPTISHQSSFQTRDADDDLGSMLDLDAALGPFKTPPLGSSRQRRELHSSRGTRDFAGPGGHYLPSPSHRRTESAPMLTPFDHARTGTPPQNAMPTFEEEEENDEILIEPIRPSSTQPGQDEESGMGVQIVDSDISANSSTPSLSLDDGLRIQHGEWEVERPTTSYGNMGSRLSTPLSVFDRRASSIIEETILEEASPVEPAIVELHEEPRAQSLTKSSDSSETPTILASHIDMLALPEGQQSLKTPESYQASAFSSPDFGRRQGSFDTSRVGTSASSITDNRTMSSCTTGEPTNDIRMSVDDVPSLTSSRSTMMSTVHANSSRRDVNGMRTPSLTSGMLDPALATERRRKRASIQSLSQLVGGSFGPRSTGLDESRPQTATESALAQGPKKKEHRLKKLMFWKSKHRQASTSTIS